MTITPKKSSFQKILLSFFGVSIFFLLLVGPLLYYSFSLKFYDNHVSSTSNQSVKYVQNVYSFIQWKSLLDPVFTVAEKNHLQDVRQIFHALSLSAIIASIIFLIVLLVFILQKKTSFLIAWFLRGSISAFLFLAVLLLAIYINFQVVFILFHQLFFPQGNWAFEPSSMLITLFPSNFFEAISVRIFFVSICLSVLVFAFDILEKRYWKKHT